MCRAVRVVRSGEMGYLKASKYFSVPRGTLERYVKDTYGSPEELVNVRLGRRTVLPSDLEDKLVEYCITLDQRYYGLRRQDIKSMAFQLAIRNGLQHPFNQEKSTAGKKWLRSFLKRHPVLSLRTPEGISAARVKGFTSENVARFFDIYESEVGKVNHQAHRIFNVDETGITTVQHRRSKVVSLRGKKEVASLTSAERGNLITVVTCMNATGTYVPPLIVFPRIKMKQELMDGAPAGSISACHPSGWIQTDIFTKWFDHFVHYVKPSADDPVLLIVDGHYSHTRNLDVVDKAREHSVAIVSLPPHSTHKMQPLDVGFLKPLKTYYAQEIETWLGNNPGRVVTPFVVCKLFGPAYRRAATMEISVNSFIKTGLFPCNRHIFQDHEYACHGMDESEDGAGNEIPRPGKSKVSFHKASGGKFISPADVRPVRQLTPKCSAITDQAQRSRASCSKLLTASPYRKQLRECREKKALSLSKKPAIIKRLFGTKRKRSLKKGKVSIQESSSESDMEIEFESADSGDDISDQDAECLFCTGLFSHDKHGEKWAQCVRCYRWAHEDCGVEEDYFVCPMCKKGVKL